MNISINTKRTLTEVSTRLNAQEWSDTQEKFIFCIDLLDINASHPDVDFLVDKLEGRFEEFMAGATYAEDIAAKRWCRYVPKHERPVLSALINASLEGGNLLSVHDGEEYVVKRSTDKALIRSQLGHTGEDSIVVRDADGEYIGQWSLIYNNGSDGDPVIVICDYTCNEWMDNIHNDLMRRYDQ
jgi:hypothetical protein